MAAHLNPERPWPYRRLLGFVALCFLAQVIFILVLGERSALPLKPPQFPTAVHLVSDSWSMERLAVFSEMGDPSVFALPSLEGFSRAGWLTYPPVPETFAESSHEPKWLQLDPGRLGGAFSAHVASNSVPALRIGDQSMPELAALQPRPSAELQFPESELQITGPLAQRKLLITPELPPWPHTDLLTNSVVQLLVDADGTPLTTALVSGSGSRDADNHALSIAKRLRFKPERSRAAITGGTANFFWRTQPPAAGTNTSSPGLRLP